MVEGKGRDAYPAESGGAMKVRRWILVGGTILAVLVATVLGLKAKVERDYVSFCREQVKKRIWREEGGLINDKVAWVPGWRVFDFFNEYHMESYCNGSPRQKPRYWFPTAVWPDPSDGFDDAVQLTRWYPFLYWDWNSWSWREMPHG